MAIFWMPFEYQSKSVQNVQTFGICVLQPSEYRTQICPVFGTLTFHFTNTVTIWISD